MAQPPERDPSPSGARRSLWPSHYASPTLLRPIERLPGKLVAVIGVLLILIVAVVDFVTPSELRFFIFYWPSIILMSWRGGRRLGLFAVALSALASTLANGAAWAAEHPYVLWWNLLANVGSFTLVAYIVVRLRGLVNWERDVARTDFVTGLPNTRAFYEALDVELSRSRRTSKPLTLAYLDMDDFKQLNDRFGHDAGDAALRDIARKIRGKLRASDVLARLGGDEFAILLPATDSAEAQTALQRLQIELYEDGAVEPWRIAFSLGGITSTTGACGADDLIRAADSLMYGVKQAGKNASHFAVLDEPGGSSPETGHL